jgi:hypothetical protein
MDRRNSDLVNPQLGRFVGVEVMHGGNKPNDLVRLDRGDEMMPRIAEKLCGQRLSGRIVEHTRRGAANKCGVARAK